ncbi:hypothetical protein GCM10028803_52270 [Larkinella knui]
MAVVLASLLIGLDACTHQVPVQENAPCSLLNFRIVNKSADPNLARIRDETVEIDGQSIKMGESSKIDYTFDAKNRPIETVFSTRGYSDYGGSSTLVYSPDTLTVKTTYLSGAMNEALFPLNEQGFVADVTYNADGFAIDEKNGPYRTTYTIENGNIIRKETRDTTDQSLFGVVVFEYDLSNVNLPNVAPFKGRNSRNLPIRETYKNYSQGKNNPPSITVYEYTYTFDRSGRPSRRFSKFGAGPVQYEVVEYGYTCRP